VLRFSPASDTEFDDLIALEDRLIEALGNEAVDGHDMGSGDCNIFILTDDPAATLNSVMHTCRSSTLFPRMKAAFRSFDEESYTPLWPTRPS
jgi:hypothetical protein